MTKWTWFFLALLLTIGATWFEYEALANAMTAGDVVGPDLAQDRQAIRELEHRSNIDTSAAAICLIAASLCLGTALRRSFSKHPIAAYIVAFLACPLASILPIWILLHLHTP
jgi:hypothetical protein